MILKTSYKNLYGQEAKRNLFLTAINTFAIFLVLPFSFLQKIVSFGTDYGVAFRYAKNDLLQIRNFSLYQISNGNNVLGVILILLAVLNGITLFSYLFSKNKQDFYFSQPVTRKALFWITYMQGIVNLVVPYVLNLILVIVLAAANQCLSGDFFVMLLQTFGVFSLLYLATYSLTVFACTLTGKMFSGVLGTGVFLGYGPILYLVVDYLFDGSLYRLDILASKIYLLSPITLFSWLDNDFWYSFRFENSGFLGAMHYDFNLIIALVLMFLISLLCARFTFLKRNAGETGKTIVFYWAKKVIKGFLVVITVLFSACIFPSLYDEFSLKYFIIGIIVGIVFSVVIYDLILEQNWKGCLRNWKEQGIYIVIAIIAVVSLKGYTEHYKYKGFDDISDEYSVEEALSDGCVVVDENEMEYLNWDFGYSMHFPVYKDVQGVENFEQFIKDVNVGKDAKLRIVETSDYSNDYCDYVYKKGVIECYKTYSLFGEGYNYSQIVRLKGKIRENEPERVYYVLTNKKNTTFQDFKEELLSNKIRIEDYECIFSYETNKTDGGNE